MVFVQFSFSDAQLAAGSWQLAVGSWQLAVGSWQYESFQLWPRPIHLNQARIACYSTARLLPAGSSPHIRNLS
ncbi:hypothetical protein EWM63_27880 [Pseudoduganella lutea]|uniref:Uncharacterized protein n=1 Tax=Pseudoduganella lutea TaxID=321985 RepID=A0A4V0Z4B1_9BURK|nr:hypothetical protein EWM63_27880 [Pseudoduganella lutea]